MCYRQYTWRMAKRKTINISITSTLNEFIDANVESGRYQSASEVVREGLRMLADSQRALIDDRSEIRRKIAVGYRQAQAGQGTDGPTFMRNLLKRRPRAKRKAG